MSSCAANNKVSLASDTIDQTISVHQVRIRIVDVQLVIFELSGKPTRHVWLQEAHVLAMIQ